MNYFIKHVIVLMIACLLASCSRSKKLRPLEAVSTLSMLGSAYWRGERDMKNFNQIARAALIGKSSLMDSGAVKVFVLREEFSKNEDVKFVLENAGSTYAFSETQSTHDLDVSRWDKIKHKFRLIE